MKQFLYDLTFDDLSGWLGNQGQKPFRAQQVFDWAYQKGAASFEEMTNLSKELRELLDGSFTLDRPPTSATSESKDTAKLLLQMPGGGQVECVRIRMGRTYTACLSTQVGCKIGCIFCATGRMSDCRNLSSGEIIAQLITLRALGAAPDAGPPPVPNVVLMGMGEPFHNYDNTVAALRMMTDTRALGMSPSRIAVSTAGIVPMIRKYTEESLPTELTISLNASNDELRAKLMPGVSRWPIADIAQAAREYSDATGGQPVTFAYVLIEGVNDLLDHARELAQLLRRQRHHLNVIPLNPVPHADLKAPTKARASAFVHHCRKFGLNVSLRKSKGAEIDAACGQLRTATTDGDGKQPQMNTDKRR